MVTRTYQELVDTVARLQKEGRLPAQPTRTQYADFAYGNTKIENAAVTRQMANSAIERKLSSDD